MLYCNNCRKEVVIYGVSHGAMSDDQLEKTRKHIEADGKIVLFNPPPFGPHNCPDCFNKLEEKNE